MEALLHRLPTLQELPTQAPYFFTDPPTPSKTLMTSDSAAHALEVAEAAIKRFSCIADDHWDRDTLATVLKGLSREENLGKSTVVLTAIRIALTGIKVPSSVCRCLTIANQKSEWPSCSRYDGSTRPRANIEHSVTRASCTAGYYRPSFIMWNAEKLWY